MRETRSVGKGIVTFVRRQLARAYEKLYRRLGLPKAHSEVSATADKVIYVNWRVDARAGGVGRCLSTVQLAVPCPGFTPDREGLVSTFSVLSSCDEVTAGVEGIVRRRM